MKFIIIKFKQIIIDKANINDYILRISIWRKDEICYSVYVVMKYFQKENGENTEMKRKIVSMLSMHQLLAVQRMIPGNV